MESRAKLLGHAIHQMLIVFPLGLLGMAVIFDVLSIAAGRRGTGRKSPSGYARGVWPTAARVITLGGALLNMLTFDFCLLTFPQSGPHVARPSAWLHGRAGTST